MNIDLPPRHVGVHRLDELAPVPDSSDDDGQIRTSSEPRIDFHYSFPCSSALGRTSSCHAEDVDASSPDPRLYENASGPSQETCLGDIENDPPKFDLTYFDNLSRELDMLPPAQQVDNSNDNHLDSSRGIVADSLHDMLQDHAESSAREAVAPQYQPRQTVILDDVWMGYQPDEEGTMTESEWLPSVDISQNQPPEDTSTQSGDDDNDWIGDMLQTNPDLYAESLTSSSPTLYFLWSNHSARR